MLLSHCWQDGEHPDSLGDSWPESAVDRLEGGAEGVEEEVGRKEEKGQTDTLPSTHISFSLFPPFVRRVE